MAEDCSYYIVITVDCVLYIVIKVVLSTPVPKADGLLLDNSDTVFFEIVNLQVFIFYGF